MDKTPKNAKRGNGILLGMSMGAGIGTAFGIYLGNSISGMAIGLGIGLMFAATYDFTDSQKAKKVRIVLAIAIILGLAIVLYRHFVPDESSPAEDEITLHIRMNTKEDIGLLVFDYSVDGDEYSGGISNADKSLIKHNSTDNIQIWNKQELGSSSDAVELSMHFRIIAEYAKPNYENVYPKDITQYIDTPVSWQAHFGKEYSITISGDKENGYKAVLDR